MRETADFSLDGSEGSERTVYVRAAARVMEGWDDQCRVEVVFDGEGRGEQGEMLQSSGGGHQREFGEWGRDRCAKFAARERRRGSELIRVKPLMDAKER